MGSVVRRGCTFRDVDRSIRLPMEESAELAAYREENLKPPPVVRGRPQPAPKNPANDTTVPRKRKAPTKNPPAAEKSRFFTKPKPEITASQLMKGGVLSPLTRTATVIEIESDEEKKPPPSISTRTKALDTSLTRTETEYSFEGDDYMGDPEFLRDLEKAETALSQLDAPSGSAGLSQVRPSQASIRQSQVSYSDTIEIDTDKENEPVPERKVRRKAVKKAVAAAPNQSVISIEDSD